MIKSEKTAASRQRKEITDADYADDIAILANTPDQPETLLHSFERAAAGIGLHVNAHKTEYMCYNQTGDITTLDGTPLKLVDKFTYLGSSVSSTEKNIDTRLTKAWTAINRLSIIWKSDLTDKIKRSLFQAAVVSILLYGCTSWTLTKRLEKKLDGSYTRMLRAILNKSRRQHPTNCTHLEIAAFLCSCHQAFSPWGLVSVHVVHPHSSIDTTAAWKKLRIYCINVERYSHAK